MGVVDGMPSRFTVGGAKSKFRLNGVLPSKSGVTFWPFSFNVNVGVIVNAPSAVDVGSALNTKGFDVAGVNVSVPVPPVRTMVSVTLS
jgi:hypothetical protein